MKKDIHPKYEEVQVTCSCGNTFITSSSIGKKELHLDVCANCHPFYTGKQKTIDTAGRVDRFKQKYIQKAPLERPKQDEKAVLKKASKTASAAKKATPKKAEKKIEKASSTKAE